MTERRTAWQQGGSSLHLNYGLQFRETIKDGSVTGAACYQAEDSTKLAGNRDRKERTAASEFVFIFLLLQRSKEQRKGKGNDWRKKVLTTSRAKAAGNRKQILQRLRQSTQIHRGTEARTDEAGLKEINKKRKVSREKLMPPCFLAVTRLNWKNKSQHYPYTDKETSIRSTAS